MQRIQRMQRMQRMQREGRFLLSISYEHVSIYDMNMI